MALYRVDEADGSLSEIPETSLSGEGMRERGDLQRWLRDNPDALEDGLFVLAEEYSDWEDSNRSIDLLALDGDGRILVIELKRDEGAFMDLQAIRYAAMVSHMTFAQAVDAHAGYLRRRGMEGDARARILEYLGAEAGGEPEIESSRPRILRCGARLPTGTHQLGAVAQRRRPRHPMCTPASVPGRRRFGARRNAGYPAA